MRGKAGDQEGGVGKASRVMRVLGRKSSQQCLASAKVVAAFLCVGCVGQRSGNFLVRLRCAPLMVMGTGWAGCPRSCGALGLVVVRESQRAGATLCMISDLRASGLQ